MLREMPIGKRMRVLLAPDADPNLLAAVLESLLDDLSGINAATRELVRNNVIEKENPGALSV
jgi:hypothetical protein